MSRHQKGKTNLDFIGARDSERQWHQLGHMQIYTSLQTNNHASTPPLSFLQAGCPSCRPTNSVKALKATNWNQYPVKSCRQHRRAQRPLKLLCINMQPSHLYLLSNYQQTVYLCFTSTAMPSVLWRCWLVGRKGIQPVKNWVVGCWHGMSGARCKLAYGPADATATHCLLLQ